MKDLTEQIYDELNAQVVRMLEHSLAQASRIAELETKLQEQDAMLGRRPCINNRCMDMVSAQSRIADLERQLAEASAPAVGKLIGIEDMCKILDAAHIKSTEYTDCTILYTVTFEQLRSLYMKGIASAPSAPAVEQQKPVAYLRFRAAQQWSGIGGHDIEHNEWLETCHAHEIGDDKMPAFPVYAATQATDTDKVREAIKYSAGLRIAIENAASGYGEFIDAGLAETIGKEVVTFLNFTMAAQAPVREVPGWQPIETAPQEGYMLVHEDGAIRALLRADGKWHKTAYPAIITADFGYVVVGEDARRILPDGYRLEVRDGCCENPTHWMPLPAAPVQQEGGNG